MKNILSRPLELQASGLRFLGFMLVELLLVVVTADHGVLPIPEWIQETSRSRCTVPGGRVEGLRDDLNAHLAMLFGEPLGEEEKPWLAGVYSRLTLNRARAASLGEDPQEILAAAREHLEAQPGVARVWTRDEVLSGGGPEPMATFYRNSWDERIAGDLAIQVEEDCLLGGSRLATSHGSPYAYDRAVPLVFFGPGIEPGRVDGPAWTVDIAPTLAALLGVRVPDDLAGRPLPMR